MPWQKGLPEASCGWRYVFVFGKPETARISKSVTGPVVSHKANDRWQGAQRLNEDQSKKLCVHQAAGVRYRW